MTEEEIKNCIHIISGVIATNKQILKSSFNYKNTRVDRIRLARETDSLVQLKKYLKTL